RLTTGATAKQSNAGRRREADPRPCQVSDTGACPRWRACPRPRTQRPLIATRSNPTADPSRGANGTACTLIGSSAPGSETLPLNEVGVLRFGAALGKPETWRSVKARYR